MGNMAAQIYHLAQQSGMVDIDTDYKRSEHAAELRAQGVTDWHSIGQQTHITESATYEKYKCCWKELGNFSKENGFGTKLTKISAECVKDFLTVKLESGKAYNTMMGYLTAINKLDGFINAATGHPARFSGIPDSMRQEIKETAPKTDTETRAFENPRAVIGAIQDPRCQLAAEIQLATGLRVHDVTFIRLNENGTLNINSKAGRRIENYQIPQQLSDRLNAINGGAGTFHLAGYNHYAYELKKACAATGEHYTGTHAFRHSYAKESFARHIEEGMSEEKAKAAVSEELFHHRLEVVEIYLR